ncbi:MAG: EAL domain-containing protein [Actinomycetota bacterium]|nr:EAL domain-containing protein [Actinomycetota bacterium]
MRRWGKALRTTAYVPASPVQIQRLLGDLLDILFDTLVIEEFCPLPAGEVGERLVTGRFTGEHSLSCIIEVLGQALLADPELHGVEDLASKVASLLGAVAGGYAGALRAVILDQQEAVKQALLTAKEGAERGLRVSEAKFRELFTSSAVGIAISDLDGTLRETNQALREIIGDPAVNLARRSVYDLFDSDDAARLRTAHQALGSESVRCRLSQRFRLIDKEGEPAWTYLAVSLLHDADDEPAQYVTIVEDVTELHLLGERLAHQSLHDALTGLPNQQFFISRLEGVLGRAGPTARITVCKIDLDGLAVINDGFGREVGDQLLCSISRHLQFIVAGEKAMVARLGSDEFSILIENSPTTPDVAALAASISAQLALPADLQGHRLAISGCIGFAEHHGGGDEPAKLFRAAEAALHGARSSGKRRWGLFDAHRDADHRIRCHLAATMPGALETGEITLHYQPLTQLIDGKVIAIEALLRWDHPHSGPLPHHECLDLAARTGLEISLGQWMLRSACEQLRSWRQRFGEATPPLHVDLTPQQSQDPDLVAGVRCALEHAGLGANGVRIGVPVVALDAEVGHAADNVRALADMGVAVVLLGFSGIGDVAHLEDLPIRAAEIVHRLVQRAAHRPGGGSGSPAPSPTSSRWCTVAALSTSSAGSRPRMTLTGGGLPEPTSGKAHSAHHREQPTKSLPCLAPSGAQA